MPKYCPLIKEVCKEGECTFWKLEEKECSLLSLTELKESLSECILSMTEEISSVATEVLRLANELEKHSLRK